MIRGSLRIWAVAAVCTALLVMVGHRFGPVWLILGGFGAVLGVGSFGVWVGWGLGQDHAAEEEFRLERHTHRRGDPAPGVLLELPVAGRLEYAPAPVLEQLAETPWVFAGGWDQGPVAEPAEHDLLTQTADPDEQAITTGEIKAIDARVDEWIETYTSQTNEFIHSMPRVIIDG